MKQAIVQSPVFKQNMSLYYHCRLRACITHTVVSMAYTHTIAHASNHNGICGTPTQSFTAINSFAFLSSYSNVVCLFVGRQPPNTPLSKRLLTDSNSHIMMYIGGHGGDEFMKFQDWELIRAQDIAGAVDQMHKQKRYERKARYLQRNVFIARYS